MTPAYTWLNAATHLKAGDRVRFADSWDIFAEDLIVPDGMTGIVTENNLNEMQPCLIVLPDDEVIRARLHEWEGTVWLSPVGENWLDDSCPVEPLA